MQIDPTLRWVLERAATPEAQRRVALFDAIAAAFGSDAALERARPAKPLPAGEPAKKKRRRR